MALTSEQEKQVLTLVDGLGEKGVAALIELIRDVPVADLKIGLLVAKDEIMRTSVMRELKDDFNSTDPEVMDAARMMARKMYSLHASDPTTDSFAMSLSEVSTLTKAELVVIFSTVDDPLPGTLISRPVGT